MNKVTIGCRTTLFWTDLIVTVRISVQTGRYAGLVFVYVQFIIFLVTPSWTGTSAKGAGTYWTPTRTHASTSSTAPAAPAASAANTATSAAPG